MSALRAQQIALDTLSHNIANANTPGYKRQRVMLGEGNPLTGPFTNGASPRVAIGTGVHVEQIQRIQDDFVDSRVRQTAALAAEWGTKSQILSQIETVFNEPSDHGIGNQLSKFWDAWDRLSAQPTDIATRDALIGQARILAQHIRNTYAEVKAIDDGIDLAVRDKVAEINALVNQIADLNARIVWAGSSGAFPNDLLDQRDLLVGQLSALAGVEVSGKGGQEFILTLGNKVLVQGVHADQLGVRLDANGAQEIYSLTTGDVRVVPGGEVAGLMELHHQAIPAIMAALDNFVATLTTEVNAIHRLGFTLDCDPAGDFFTEGSTAANFSVAADILDSPRNVAASASGSVGNNTIALRIAALRSEALPAGQTISQLYQTIVTEMGTQSALAKHYADTQSLTLEQFSAQQQSVSGVSLDEEMTDMVRFQQAYNAAARVLTACDEMLSMLIERTGVVGR